MDLAVLIVSCDAYADAWAPFFKNFFQYWPQCPYPIYLQTNLLKPDFPQVNIVAVGEDRDWSTNLINALGQLKENKVLLLLEDFWLWQPVNTAAIQTLAASMDVFNAGYLRLVPKPPADELLPARTDLGLIHKGSLYRVSFQAGLWQKNVLQHMLQSGESAWEAEMQGSLRSMQSDSLFLSVPQMSYAERPIHYMNAIIKRKWTPEAVATAKLRGIVLDLTQRKVCNAYDQLRRKKLFRQLMNQLARLSKNILSPSLYRKIKNQSWVKKIIY